MQENIMGADAGINIPMEERFRFRPKIMGMQPNHPMWSPDLSQPDQQVPQQQIISRPQQQVNPFNDNRFNAVPMPDVPLQYNGGMAEALLNDDEVPEEIRKKNWHIFHKDNVIGFQDIETKKSKLLNLDIIRIDELSCIPYYDYTFEKELQLNILRNVFETKIDRAVGFKHAGTKNERIMLQSQFQENRQINEIGDNTNQIKEGFFKRLIGRR